MRLRFKIELKQLLDEHQRGCYRCAEVMRDRRGETFERLVNILLFKNFALKLYLVDMFCHVLEVNGNDRVLQVLDFL